MGLALACGNAGPRQTFRPRRDPDAARTGRTGGAAPAGDRGAAQLDRDARGADGLANCDGSSRRQPRASEDGGHRTAGRAIRRVRPHGVRLPVRQGASSAGDRLQRRRTPAGRELLRSAGFGSEVVQFRGDRAGTAAAGELVCPGAPAHHRRRRTDPAFLERLDVRVPHAAPGDADLRKHAARPDL